MVNKKNLVVACLLIAGGIIAFSMFFQSDEAKIKKKFQLLYKQKRLQNIWSQYSVKPDLFKQDHLSGFCLLTGNKLIEINS